MFKTIISLIAAAIISISMTGCQSTPQDVIDTTQSTQSTQVEGKPVKETPSNNNTVDIITYDDVKDSKPINKVKTPDKGASKVTKKHHKKYNNPETYDYSGDTEYVKHGSPHLNKKVHKKTHKQEESTKCVICGRDTNGNKNFGKGYLCPSCQEEQAYDKDGNPTN